MRSSQKQRAAPSTLVRGMGCDDRRVDGQTTARICHSARQSGRSYDNIVMGRVPMAIERRLPRRCPPPCAGVLLFKDRCPLRKRPAPPSASECASPDPLEPDLNVEVIVPLLVSSNVLCGLTICSFCEPPLQKTNHQVQSRLRELHLLESQVFPPFLFVHTHY
jgi:hypothetical protein